MSRIIISDKVKDFLHIYGANKQINGKNNWESQIIEQLIEDYKVLKKKVIKYEIKTLNTENESKIIDLENKLSEMEKSFVDFNEKNNKVYEIGTESIIILLKNLIYQLNQKEFIIQNLKDQNNVLQEQLFKEILKNDFENNEIIKELTTPNYKNYGFIDDENQILKMDPLNLWKNLFEMTQKAFPKIYNKLES